MAGGLIDIFSTAQTNTIYPWLQLPPDCPPHEHLKPIPSTPPTVQP
jgi:hypothetical protein